MLATAVRAVSAGERFGKCSEPFGFDINPHEHIVPGQRATADYLTHDGAPSVGAPSVVIDLPEAGCLTLLAPVSSTSGTAVLSRARELANLLIVTGLIERRRQ